MQTPLMNALPVYNELDLGDKREIAQMDACLFFCFFWVLCGVIYYSYYYLIRSTVLVLYYHYSTIYTKEGCKSHYELLVYV